MTMKTLRGDAFSERPRTTGRLALASPTYSSGVDEHGRTCEIEKRRVSLSANLWSFTRPPWCRVCYIYVTQKVIHTWWLEY